MIERYPVSLTYSVPFKLLEYLDKQLSKRFKPYHQPKFRPQPMQTQVELDDRDPDAKTANTNDFQSIFSLAGKVAVVTGGTGVLGSTLAIGLARAGAKVGVLGRRSDAAEATSAA